MPTTQTMIQTTINGVLLSYGFQWRQQLSLLVIFTNGRRKKMFLLEPQQIAYGDEALSLWGRTTLTGLDTILSK